MPSAQDYQADLRRMRWRFRLIIAAVTFGAFVLVAGAMAGAFVVIDQRVAKAFKAEPTRDAERRSSSEGPSPSGLSVSAGTQTQGRASASPGAGSPPAPQQAVTGETAPAPEEMLDQQNSRDEVHHGRRRHHRRHWR
jgi:hypothetical protein